MPSAQQPVPSHFNWIDTLAIPILTCIMEAQPIALALLLFSQMAFDQQLGWVLGAGTVTLLLLGLQWWVMLTEQLSRSLADPWKPVLRLLGPCLAIALMALSVDLFSLIPVSVFILFFWRLGIFQSQPELRDERLIATFRVGFIVMLVLSFFALAPNATAQPLALLGKMFPLFFLSGLLALSFTRLSSINREHARQTGAIQARSTRRWFVFLTTMWGVLVAAAIVLEFFAFQLVQYVLLPFWELLGFLVLEILYLLGLLFYFLGKLLGIPQSNSSNSLHHLPPPQTLAQQTTHSTASPLLLLMLRIALIIIVVIALIFIVRMILRYWPRTIQPEEEEEIRETLSLQEILRERRQEQQQQKQQEFAVESLDTPSVRARYRAFLQAVAESNTHLGRRTDETPHEYQRRLTMLLQPHRFMSDEVLHNIKQDRMEIETLTQAYTQERYGGRSIALSSLEAFQAWLQRLQNRLKDV